MAAKCGGDTTAATAAPLPTHPSAAAAAAAAATTTTERVLDNGGGGETPACSTTGRRSPGGEGERAVAPHARCATRRAVLALQRRAQLGHTHLPTHRFRLGQRRVGPIRPLRVAVLTPRQRHLRGAQRVRWLQELVHRGAHELTRCYTPPARRRRRLALAAAGLSRRKELRAADALRSAVHSHGGERAHLVKVRIRYRVRRRGRVRDKG